MVPYPRKGGQWDGVYNLAEHFIEIEVWGVHARSLIHLKRSGEAHL